MRHEHMLAWTPEEDMLILQLFASEGRKWGKIAGVLKGRSSASVRNRYLRIEKGRQLREEGKSKNRCAACGQHKLGHVCTVKASGFAFQPCLTGVPVQALRAPSPLTISSMVATKVEEADPPTPPLATSVVATVDPTFAPSIEPTFAALPQPVANENSSSSNATPNLACNQNDYASDDPMRRLAWHGLPLVPILKRLPSSAAA